MWPQSRRVTRMGLVAAAAAALLGCASNSGQVCATCSAAVSRKTVPLPGKPACFRVADFDGSWITLNDREFIVRDPVFSRSYLLKMSQPVYDLQFREFLGFEPFTPANGCICNGFNAYVLAAHSGLAGHVPIVAVRELSQRQEQLLLSKHHIKLTAGPDASGLGQQNNGCPEPRGES